MIVSKSFLASLSMYIATLPSMVDLHTVLFVSVNPEVEQQCIFRFIFMQRSSWFSWILTTLRWHIYIFVCVFRNIVSYRYQKMFITIWTHNITIMNFDIYSFFACKFYNWYRVRLNFQRRTFTKFHFHAFVSVFFYHRNKIIRTVCNAGVNYKKKWVKCLFRNVELSSLLV